MKSIPSVDEKSQRVETERKKERKKEKSKWRRNGQMKRRNLERVGPGGGNHGNEPGSNHDNGRSLNLIPFRLL